MLVPPLVRQEPVRSGVAMRLLAPAVGSGGSGPGGAVRPRADRVGAGARGGAEAGPTRGRGGRPGIVDARRLGVPGAALPGRHPGVQAHRSSPSFDRSGAMEYMTEPADRSPGHM